MKLDHIDLSRLKLSPLNVRKHGGDDVADLLPSIRMRGVLQPLLVRPDGDLYEVIAGQRRLKACQLLAGEGITEPVPCAIMEDGDDADAIAASLDENIQRLPMDEIDQYEAFADLRKKGRSVEDIADTFGVTDRLVKQRLAIANLHASILTLYRNKEISSDTMRSLTLATKPQQKAWLKRFRAPDDYAPQGRQLRQWLLGGEQIATSVALFPLDDYAGAIVTDLFGEEAYFADPETFWILQGKAIVERIEAYRERGWADVVSLGRGVHWPSYDYAKVSKKQDGKVYVVVGHNGEITFHEGYLSEKEVRKQAVEATRQSEATALSERPELTKAAQNYVDLHRYAAVQAALLANSGMALRVITAHMIAGSSLWDIRPEPQRADKPATKLSVTTSVPNQRVRAEHDAVLELLGLAGEEDEFAPLVNTTWSGRSFPDVFAALLSLDDAQVLRVLTYAMAETLQAGTVLIDTLGTLLSVNMAQHWTCDNAFLDLVVAKTTLASMLGDVGGSAAADAHKASTSKVMRNVIHQYVSGKGREKVEGWVPPYLGFPAATYAESGASGDEEEAMQDAA